MFNIRNLPNFGDAKILVFGDLMLDSYWRGVSNRVSPEAPVPVVKVEKQDTCPGGAANVALNLASIGVGATLIGLVGEDLQALDLRSQLEAKNINCQFKSVPGLPTISKMRVIARNQQMLRLDFESSFADYDDEDLISIYKEELDKANIVVLSDYGKGTLKKSAEIIALAKSRNIPVLVDPKGMDYKIYAGASLITPNLAEFEAVVGPCGDDEALIVAKAKALIRAHDFGAILVTRGKLGMTLIDANDTVCHLHSQAREVFDVTGAGDTVISIVAAALAQSVDLERACYLANIAAGLVVAKVGAASVSMPELRHALRNNLGLDLGVLTEEELLLIVEDAKAKGEKIVMTNGCFDVLHAGHIQYLSQAKACGDRLIVAVNTDASVSRLKGDSRPINPLEVRMELLSALRCVDWVLPFSEDTPLRLINAISPDCLVKGGDYTIETVVGHKTVLDKGGEVKILSFREGYSTTKMVEKIKAE